MAPPKSEAKGTVTYTVRFNQANLVQAATVRKLERLAEVHPEASGVAWLIAHIVNIFIEEAEEHPAINADVAQTVAANMPEFKLWLEAQKSATPPTSAPQEPKSSPPAPPTGDVDGLDIDFNKL